MASKAKRLTSSSEAMDTDEASRHTQNILSTVTQPQEVKQVTSRTVEILSNKIPEESADETLGELDMDMTILDMDRLPDRFLGVSGQNPVWGDPSEGLSGDLERTLSKLSGLVHHHLPWGLPPLPLS